jgi:glycosyltransferase involved in cell wall biosynthesis
MPNKIILVSRCAWTLYNFHVGLMRALKHRGALVIGGGAGGDGFESRITALGVPFIALPISKKAINPLADVRLFYTLYHWYRRERPDVVHHFTIKPVIYGSLAARLAGVPRVVNTITGLGFVFIEEGKAWLRCLVEWQYRLALACAHCTFFQNGDDLRLFRARHLIRWEKTVLLLGSGVDCQFFAPTIITESAPTLPLTFLMVARLLREKGVEEFIEAARRVKRNFPETRFQLLGARDERNPTVVPQTDLDRWQGEGVVSWLGEVPDVREIVGRANVVVLPSYREGTPRALLEAAAMGKPLITTDTVGCREVVVDGVSGLLVPVKDAEALAQAMVKLSQNPEMRERMGKAGREKMQREFDERLVIEKILQAYQQQTLSASQSPTAVQGR